VSVSTPGTTVVLTDSDFEFEVAGLQSAYRAGKPILVGSTLFIPGTRRWTDLLDDVLIFPPAFGNTLAVRDAERAYFANRGKVQKVVGHSLGGAVAATLGKKYGLYSATYGSPISGDTNYADARDIVAIPQYLSTSKVDDSAGFMYHGIGGYRKPSSS